MPKKHQRVRVVKIPLKRSSIDRPQVFPRMPRLYLELIENKAKIKQDLINKEYSPPAHTKHQDTRLEFVDDTPPKRHNQEDSRFIPHKERNKSPSANTDSDFEDPPPPRQRESKEFENRLDRLLSDESDDSDVTIEKKSPGEESNISSNSELSISEKNSADVKDKDGYSSEDSDELSARLKELLNEDSDSDVSYGKIDKSLERSSKRSSTDKYSRHRDKDGHSVPYASAYGAAPTLAELEKQGGYIPRRELRDINQTSLNEQQEENAKREFLFKFDLLRKSYPSAIIPEYSIHTELQTMQKSYEDSVRRLSLDSSVENYKMYLVYGFMGCEFVFGNFLGFDMQGFTQQQITSMNSYEKLLIELGEKSFVPSGSKWPVELRLLFMIIMNAAFFVISKMIMKKTGANLMGMINSMNTNPATSTDPSVRKRKMRGPNIDLGDIPDIGTSSSN